MTTDQDHSREPTDWQALALEEQAKKSTGVAVERAAEIEQSKQKVRDDVAARDLELKKLEQKELERREEARRAAEGIS